MTNLPESRWQRIARSIVYRAIRMNVNGSSYNKPVVPQKHINITARVKYQTNLFQKSIIYEEVHYRLRGYGSCFLTRVSVSAGRDRWNRNCSQTLLDCKSKRIAITGRQQFGILSARSSLDRTNSMNHISSCQPAARGNDSLACR